MVVALLFVTLPFVVRAVQPLLIEIDREMEEAAASLGAGGFTVFRRIIFPNLLPGLVAGVALAFARALGEFGSLVLISRQHPLQDRGLLGLHPQPDRVRQRLRRRRRLGRPAGASLLLLAGVTLVQRWGGRHERGDGSGLTVMPISGEDPQLRRKAAMTGSSTASRWSLRGLALGYLTLLLLAPAGDDLLQDLRGRDRRRRSTRSPRPTASTR